MIRDQILKKLRELKPELRRDAHVAAIAVFGSVARGDAQGDSDIDILVEFDQVPDFFTFVRLQDHLTTILETEVDLFTKGGLHPALKDRILSEAVYA